MSTMFVFFGSNGNLELNFGINYIISSLTNIKNPNHQIIEVQYLPKNTCNYMAIKTGFITMFRDKTHETDHLVH